MKFDTWLSYKQIQIIKHALQHYVKRDGATQEDLVSEQALLNRIENQVNEVKDRYGIG